MRKNSLNRFFFFFLFSLFFSFLFFSILHPQEMPSITIDCSEVRGSVSPYLFGSNIEWAREGNGVWDRKKDTFRIGVEDLVKELNPSIIRFPGGSLSDHYNWRNGVGPQQSRKLNKVALKQNQTAVFGTAEFGRLLKINEAQGMITVNVGTGTASEAADWVTYCNGRDYTKMGALRAEHGSADPLNVQYWEIGNELYGRWETGHKDIMAYAMTVIDFVNAMKGADNRIKIGAAVMPEPRGLGVKDEQREWNSTLLEIVGKKLDFIAVHFYEPHMEGKKVIFYANGERSFDFQSSYKGKHTFHITASGTVLDDIYPVMQCTIDDRPPHKISLISKEEEEYVFSEDLMPGKHILRIAFINDEHKPPEDRNLFISEVNWQAGTQQKNISVYDEEDFFKAVMASTRNTERQLKEIKKTIRQYLPESADRLKLAVTEFNASYGKKKSQLKQISEFKSGLLVADMLHVFIKNNVFMANFWSLIGNGHYGCIRDSSTLIKRPSFHVLKMLGRHRENQRISTMTWSPGFSTEHFGQMEIFQEIPYLSEVCTISRNKDRLILSVINKHHNRSMETKINILDFLPRSEAKVITLKALSIEASNEKESGRVIPEEKIITNVSPNFVYLFPKHSLTVIEIQAARSEE